MTLRYQERDLALKEKQVFHQNLDNLTMYPRISLLPAAVSPKPRFEVRFEKLHMVSVRNDIAKCCLLEPVMVLQYSMANSFKSDDIDLFSNLLGIHTTNGEFIALSLFEKAITGQLAQALNCQFPRCDLLRPLTHYLNRSPLRPV